MSELPQEILDVAIIGSGFAGLGMAIKLRQEGRRSFVVLEKEAALGGTWLVNHYPGCACDVQSHLYSFSFEQNPDWSRTFSPQSEIRDYLEHCADKYDVRRAIRFGCEVTRARFDEAAACWELTAADGQQLRARVLVSGMGGLSRPSIPDFPGLSEFRGYRFHSQQWDHEYPLEGKRVAVIGTGASAIQLVPRVAEKVAHLDLYQRTPPWVLSKPDFRVAPFWRRLFRQMPWTQRLFRTAIYWHLEGRAFAFTRFPAVMKLIQPMARRFIARQIRDPALRAKLTPDYTLGCKRVLMANDYYPTLDREHVDVHSGGVKGFTATGVIGADGLERPADAVILATGFAATEPLPPGAIIGRDGVDIVEAWKDTGPEAYLGCTVAGFPNLFILAGPNTGLGHSSMVFMIESQIAYVMDALRRMDQDNLASVDLKPAVQAEYNRRLQRRMQRTVWETGGCRSWYMDAGGKNVALWPNFTWQFRLRTRRFRLNDYDWRPHPRASASGAVATHGAQA